jgi:hypothetical protein
MTVGIPGSSADVVISNGLNGTFCFFWTGRDGFSRCDHGVLMPKKKLSPIDLERVFLGLMSRLMLRLKFPVRQNSPARPVNGQRDVVGHFRNFPNHINRTICIS